MHEDICITAEEKYTSLIVLPYYKTLNEYGDEVVNHGFQQVTRKMLKTAPCSMAILVDRGLGGFSSIPPAGIERHVAVLFFGGPDDREALFLARRMVEHPGVSLTVYQFGVTDEAGIGLQIEQQAGGTAAVASTSFAVSMDKGHLEHERKADELSLAPVLEMLPKDVQVGRLPSDNLPVSTSVTGQTFTPEKKQRGGDGEIDEEDGEEEYQKPRTVRPKIAYEQRKVDDVFAALNALAEEDFDLFVVGRGRKPSLALAGLAAQRTPLRSYIMSPFGTHQNQAEGASGNGTDLGPVGDVLAAASTHASVLVVQQHDEAMVRPFSAV